MADLHDAALREALKARLRTVTAESPRRWGAMTPDQMMWHVAEGLQWYFGDLDVSGMKLPPLPRPVMRFMVLNLPWPKGAPTMPGLKTAERHDLEAERARCFELMERFAARPIAGKWLEHPLLGSMSGRDCSRLQARHIDHHLRQFGA